MQISHIFLQLPSPQKHIFLLQPCLFVNAMIEMILSTRKESAILDARAMYPDSSLADLYDDLTRPPELRKAHQNNDKAVLDAYGFTKGTAARTSESACAAELMKLYQKLTEG